MIQSQLITHQPVASPDGTLVASVEPSRLLVQGIANPQHIQRFSLPQGFGVTSYRLRWSDRVVPSAKISADSRTSSGLSLRLLVANDEALYVFDIGDPKWHAIITCAASNLGKISNVDFGSNPDEILVFSDFGVRATIWSMATSRGSEIKDPKAVTRNYAYRPQTGHLAILTRPVAHDYIMLVAPGSHEVLKTFETPTVDAQGLAWSCDGRWLAVWDTSSCGYKVLLYTADGNLFKTYLGGQDSNEIGLGVRSVKWSHSGIYLAIADHNDRIIFLSQKSLSPALTLGHKSPIESPSAHIWHEQISATNERSYILSNSPAYPPTTTVLSNNNISTSLPGISTLEFNMDDTLTATKSDSMPTTVWIWSPTAMALEAVLIHHSPIKAIQWHPSDPSLLLIHCAINEPVLHLWSTGWSTPRIITLALPRPHNKLQAAWLCNNKTGDKARFMLSKPGSYVTAQTLVATGEMLSPEEDAQFAASGPEDMFDEGNSLLDFSSVKIDRGETVTRGWGNGDTTAWAAGGEMDDTFHYRKQNKT